MYQIVLFSLLAAGPNQNVDVAYKQRASPSGITYHEGSRDHPIRGQKIKLLAATINDSAIHAEDEMISARFYFPPGEDGSAHLLVRELELESYYRLDRVDNRWKPGEKHVFQWSSNVLSALKRKYPGIYSNLGGVVRVGLPEPSLQEIIAPIYLTSLSGKRGSNYRVETSEVKKYSFFFKCNFRSQIHWRIMHNGKKVIGGVKSNPYSGHFTKIEVNSESYAPGKYQMDVVAVNQVNLEKHYYNGTFHHEKTI